MYNPRIREELIPRIYEVARARGIRMTVLVNEIMEKALLEIEEQDNQSKQISTERFFLNAPLSAH